MLTLDDRPAPPALPRFSQDLEQFLVAAARADTAAPVRVSRRRPPGRYVAVAAAGAVAAAAAVGIDYALEGGSHTPSAKPPTGTISSPGAGAHLAAFSVVSDPGGRVTLTVTQGQLFDPSAMQAALERAHVPATVAVGKVCTVPGLPSNGLPEVVSRSQNANGQSVTVITPSAIPSGQELSIGYYAIANGGGLYIGLVPENVHLTCTAGPPAPPHHGRG